MRWKVPAAVVLLAVGAGAVVLAVTGGPGGSRASTPQYLTARAATADIAETVVANGSLVRATTYALDFGAAPTVTDSSATGSGNGTWSVTQVKVNVGDVVKKGAVLAVADSTSLQRDLKAARSSLAAAKTQRTIAKGQWDDASGTDARRQARIGYDNALSQYTQAQGQVADLQAQIARATIVAPADGTVDAVTAVAGADITGGPAITLVSGPLQATADFTESDLPSLKVGQPANVTVDAIDASVPGKVVAIAPSAASSSGSSSGSVVTYAVTIELTGAPEAARPGMSAKASVTIAQAANVLAVPAVALNGSALGYTVLVVGQDGTAQTRDVTVGLVTSTQAEIQSGLQAGESVVIGTTASQTTTTGGGGGFFPGGGGFQRGGNGGGGGNNNGGNTQQQVVQP
jgi:macrolide-specific efflux system membrane fusion protein